MKGKDFNKLADPSELGSGLGGHVKAQDNFQIAAQKKHAGGSNGKAGAVVPNSSPRNVGTLK